MTQMEQQQRRHKRRRPPTHTIELTTVDVVLSHDRACEELAWKGRSREYYKLIHVPVHVPQNSIQLVLHVPVGEAPELCLTVE